VTGYARKVREEKKNKTPCMSVCCVMCKMGPKWRRWSGCVFGFLGERKGGPLKQMPHPICVEVFLIIF